MSREATADAWMIVRVAAVTACVRDRPAFLAKSVFRVALLVQVVVLANQPQLARLCHAVVAPRPSTTPIHREQRSITPLECEPAAGRNRKSVAGPDALPGRRTAAPLIVRAARTMPDSPPLACDPAT